MDGSVSGARDPRQAQVNRLVPADLGALMSTGTHPGPDALSAAGPPRMIVVSRPGTPTRGAPPVVVACWFGSLAGRTLRRTRLAEAPAVDRDQALAAAAAPGARGVRNVAGAYVALTKPRIIELLLITTIPAMFAAQRQVPPLGLLARHAGRRHPGRRQRQRAQLRRRRRHRRGHAADPGPPAGPARGVHPRRAVFGIVLGVLAAALLWADHDLAGGRARGRRHPVLRLRVLDVAQAPHLAEHRLGWPGRAACR